MRSRVLGAMCASILVLITTATNAASVLDFGIEAPTLGTISFAGGAAPLIGTGIDVDTIVGDPTPLNSGAPITCDACILSLATGAHTGNWNFGAGGTISIIGGVPTAGVAAGTTLLTGSFDSAIVSDIGGSFFNFKIAGASFFDTKDETLLGYFGLPSGGYRGGLNISFDTIGAPAVGTTFNSDTLRSGDVINSPVVPVPAAVWLFGSGLLGLVGIARRKKA